VSLDRSFLEAVFGGAEGYAHFAIGMDAHADPTGGYKHRKWKSLAVPWPQQAEDAMRQLDDVLSQPGSNDLYVCPNILKTDKRNKETAVTYQLLHSDADDGADPSKVAARGGFAVCSGSPGHAHVFVRLARDVTLAQYQTLQQGMRAYLDGDNKISDNDLLRPVGSVNHKAVVLHGLDQALWGTDGTRSRGCGARGQPAWTRRSRATEKGEEGVVCGTGYRRKRST
jgi:putative DNA primase/helicase